MQLYTSLVRLKQEMNGGQIPPMTPVTGDALDAIDPSFTIGLGALEESTEKGLRCPVRGCGKYFHRLKKHFRVSHADIGGVEGILRRLSIPINVPLDSTIRRERIAKLAVDRNAASSLAASSSRGGMRNPTTRSKAHRARSASFATVGYRNLLNNCKAQLGHKLLDAQNQIGRSPSVAEAEQLLGRGVVAQTVRVFGSWNAAKATLGMSTSRFSKRFEKDHVIESLAAWHSEHGTLPSYRDTRKVNRTPVLPDSRTMIRALGASSHTHAMQIAASILNIYGGRYGLPERTPQETAAD